MPSNNISEEAREDPIDQIKGMLFAFFLLWLATALAMLWFLLLGQRFWAITSLACQAIGFLMLFYFTARHIEFLAGRSNFMSSLYVRHIATYIVFGLGIVLTAYFYFIAN